MKTELKPVVRGVLSLVFLMLMVTGIVWGADGRDALKAKLKKDFFNRKNQEAVWTDMFGKEFHPIKFPMKGLHTAITVKDVNDKDFPVVILSGNDNKLSHVSFQFPWTITEGRFSLEVNQDAFDKLLTYTRLNDIPDDLVLRALIAGVDQHEGEKQVLMRAYNLIFVISPIDFEAGDIVFMRFTVTPR